jgi:hypothetical protein
MVFNLLHRSPSPAQRTAGTARLLLLAGLAFALEALWRDSVGRVLVAGAVMFAGASLLAFAKRTG